VFTQQSQAWGLLVATGIFGVTAVLTRAKRGRSIGALLGALVMSALNIVWDIGAHQFGWWTYPSAARGFASFAIYLAQDVVWGGAFGLVGWRVHRRFGVCALVTFIGLLSMLGALRDRFISSRTHIIAFGPGSLPLLADAACWLTLLAAAQITIRLVAGPPAADSLARTTMVSKAEQFRWRESFRAIPASKSP
jgi:hypothetical protein